MKLYFKTVVSLLMMGLAFASCNDNFDEDEARVSYPGNFELGIWESEYTAAGGTEYTVNLTLNEAGDTICDVTMFNTATSDANVLSAGAVSYDQTTGVITATYEESPWETPAMVSITYKNAGDKMTVNVYANDGKLANKGLFTAVKSNKISVLGDWMLADGSVLSLNADSTASLVKEEVTSEGTYTWDGQLVVATLENNTIDMSINAYGQMSATVNGSTAYCQHIMTQPKNDWYDFAIGQYQSWLFDLLPDAVIMQYSPSRRMGRLNTFSPLPGCVELTFYWNVGESKVAHAEASYDTGYDHVQNGEMLGRVFAFPAAISEDGQTAMFDAKQNAFIFGHAYQIPGVGQFGADVDAFIVSEYAE